MSGRVDIERTLDQFLAEGPDHVADRALQHALDEIDRTPQRRGMFAPWRFSPMNTYARIGITAVIAALAIGGTLYVLSARTNVGPAAPTPSPAVAPTTAAAKPSPTTITETPIPTTNLDTATWTTYAASRYGYSLSYPAGWAAVPAFYDWVVESRFEFWSSAGEGADRFINSFKPRDTQEHLIAMSAVVPGGVTETAWIDAFEKLPAGFTLDATDCLTTAAEMSAITISGHDGRISTKCEMSAFVLVDGRMYIFSVDGDEALFRAFLSTVRLPAPAAS